VIDAATRPLADHVAPSPTPDAGRTGGRHRGVVNVYAADAAGDLSPLVRGDPALVYVPNILSNTVDGERRGVGTRTVAASPAPGEQHHAESPSQHGGADRNGQVREFGSRPSDPAKRAVRLSTRRSAPAVGVDFAG
jgi:hypothetical protein